MRNIPGVTAVQIRRLGPFTLEYQEGRGLFIDVYGYGTFHDQTTVFIDLQDLHPEVLIWADIQSEDSTDEISLELAHESRRLPDVDQ